MALKLAFTAVESADNKTLTLTDSSGVYDVSTNPTGWGTPNTTLASINTGYLTLTPTVITSDGIETSYDAIDLHALITGHTTVADLVFPITCALFKVSGTPTLGTASDVLPDGLYYMAYAWTSTTPTHTDETILLDGNVKTNLYELIRTIPTKYESEGCHSKEILDIILAKGYYDSMIATAAVGREDEVVDQLFVLERLILNGSNYSW
jgi:hypothetical protein